MKMKLPFPVVVFILACGIGLVSNANAANSIPATNGQEKQCNRMCMARMMDWFFDAMLQHDSQSLPISATLKATLNGQPTKLEGGIWETAQRVKFRLDAVDSDKQEAATEAVVQDDTGLALMLVRLRVRDGQITEAEMLMPQRGGPLYAPEKLAMPPQLYLKKVRDPERATRLQLIAAADNYFTALQMEGTSAYTPAPLAPDANRFENGLQTTNVPFTLFHKPAATAQQQMDEAWFKGWIVKDRRFPVLDEEHGIILGIALMQVSPAQAVLLAELFKVSDWKIRQVQAVLVGVPHDGPTGWN